MPCAPHTGSERSRQRLADRRVLVVGIGGLGTVAAAHLAAAGVGTLGIIDPDCIELSNLHRQLLHHTADLGRPKVASARERLLSLQPGLIIEAIQGRLDTHNVARLIAAYDFVIDGSDNVATKFLLNDAAVVQGVPFSHGGVLGLLGQTMTVAPGRSACCRCLFLEPPPAGELPACQEAGILGPVAGVIGVIQAAQAVAYLTGSNGLLLDRLLTYDGSHSRWRSVPVRQNPRCPACGSFPGATRRTTRRRDHAAR